MLSKVVVFAAEADEVHPRCNFLRSHFVAACQAGQQSAAEGLEKLQPQSIATEQIRCNVCFKAKWK
jgi:hypothetical protein